MERLKEQRQIIKSFPKDCLFSTNVAMEHNVMPLGDVAKKYARIIGLLQVRKAQNQL
jgi:hypothetical protein